MKKKPTQDQVRKEVDRLILELGLERWTVGVAFARVNDDPEAHAACDPSWEYKDVRFVFDLDHSRWLDPTVTLTSTIAHEMIHCIVNPLAVLARDKSTESDLVSKLEEMVVTHIERLSIVQGLEQTHTRS